MIKSWVSSQNIRKVYLSLFIEYTNYINWKPPRKSGLTTETTEARILCYAIIQGSRLFLELTHSSLEASS